MVCILRMGEHSTYRTAQNNLDHDRCMEKTIHNNLLDKIYMRHTVCNQFIQIAINLIHPAINTALMNV